MGVLDLLVATGLALRFSSMLVPRVLAVCSIWLNGRTGMMNPYSEINLLP